MHEEGQSQGEGGEGGDVEAVADGVANSAALRALVRLLRGLRVAGARKLYDLLPGAGVPEQARACTGDACSSHVLGLSPTVQCRHLTRPAAGG